jgi:uncharacterized protein (TIGR03067 family)
VKRRAMMTLAVGLLISGAAPEPALDGRWFRVAQERDGRTMAPDVQGYGQLFLSGDRFRYIPPGESAPSFPYGKIVLDTTSRPEAIDFMYDYRGTIVRGIYRLDGDILRLLRSPPNRPRPEGFTKGVPVEVWKRFKPGEPFVPTI